MRVFPIASLAGRCVRSARTSRAGCAKCQPRLSGATLSLLTVPDSEARKHRPRRSHEAGSGRTRRSLGSKYSVPGGASGQRYVPGKGRPSKYRQYLDQSGVLLGQLFGKKTNEPAYLTGANSIGLGEPTCTWEPSCQLLRSRQILTMGRSNQNMSAVQRTINIDVRVVSRTRALFGYFAAMAPFLAISRPTGDYVVKFRFEDRSALHQMHAESSPEREHQSSVRPTRWSSVAADSGSGRGGHRRGRRQNRARAHVRR